jgi:ATP-binding cassette subfamily B protein
MQLLADVVALMNAPVSSDHLLAGESLDWQRLGLVDVGFRHGERGFAIEAATLTIQRGSRTGISGPTGAGKSTLLDLIIGLIEPDTGVIRIDDQPLDPANRRAWMAQIAHVPQSIFLADDSIAANIAFGRRTSEIDHERLARVIAAARLTEFIADLPDGLETRVGERGIRLSGGQRQRIGIARALYKPAQILILDEATSALDDATEAAVMAGIAAFGERRTIIIVAHRQSTLAGCDQIITVERGRVRVRDSSGRAIRPVPSRRSIRNARG